MSDTLVGSFLDALFLLLAVIFSELYEKLRSKDSVTAKSEWKNLCEEHHFFDCTPTFQCHFCCFFRLLPPFSPKKWRTCLMFPI